MSDAAERMDIIPVRVARARRVRIYWGVAWLCGIVILLAGVTKEILVNRQVLPPWLNDMPVSEGFSAIAGGWISLAIWLQVDYQRLSGVRQLGQRAENQRIKRLMSVVRRLITVFLITTPTIALLLVLTHRVTGAAYGQAAAVITLTSFANFVWVTVGCIRWLLELGKKNSR